MYKLILEEGEWCGNPLNAMESLLLASFDALMEAMDWKKEVEEKSDSDGSDDGAKAENSGSN